MAHEAAHQERQLLARKRLVAHITLLTALLLIGEPALLWSASSDAGPACVGTVAGPSVIVFDGCTPDAFRPERDPQLYLGDSEEPEAAWSAEPGRKPGRVVVKLLQEETTP